MEALNLENVKETAEFTGESKKIVPGGYVCEIIAVTDCKKGYNPQKPDSGDFLKIEFDVAEGDFASYYHDLSERFGFWGGVYIRSYKPTALGVFKAFVNAVQESNPGYVWDWNEQSLVGKKIGIVLAPDTYTGMDGKIKTKMKVVSVKSVDDIRAGKYRHPVQDTSPEVAPVPVKVVDMTQAASDPTPATPTVSAASLYDNLKDNPSAPVPEQRPQSDAFAQIDKEVPF